MTHFLGNITKQSINLIYNEIKKPCNKKKLTSVVEIILKSALSYLTPYLYAIIAILVVLFLMNCFQFFYYTRIVLQLNEYFNINSNVPLDVRM